MSDEPTEPGRRSSVPSSRLGPHLPEAPLRRQPNARAACYLTSLAIVLGVATFNRRAVLKGRLTWTESFLEVLADPLAVLSCFLIAALLTWALGRLRIRRETPVPNRKDPTSNTDTAPIEG
jgi:hypothetical protein